MQNFIKLPAIFILLVLMCVNAKSQGCSDAGFCSIGNLAQQPQAGNPRQLFTIQFPAGIGDENVVVFTPSLQYDNQLNKKWSVQAKLTANYANGDLGTATGPGDFYVSGTYIFPHTKNEWRFSATAGAKLPLNQSNLKSDGRSLPMQYQSSLGTVDLITGLSLSNSKWQFAAGWQQPLTGTNGNNFLPVYFINKEADQYIPSNDFNRKADVLLRGLYKYRLNDRLDFKTGLLAIYHLGEDTYIDGNTSSQPISIRGSGGLTLNASLAGWYALNKKMKIGIAVAVPLVVRDLRPDGLTRSFVVSPEISWTF